MKIYIASSWKNQHAVELLTTLLRQLGYEVASFVEDNFNEGAGAEKPADFEKWVLTDNAFNSFIFDTENATGSHLVIYIGPSGCDAWAEVGAAFASGVPVIGLYAKGEQIGLMRKMVFLWCNNYHDLLTAVAEFKKLRRV